MSLIKPKVLNLLFMRKKPAFIELPYLLALIARLAKLLKKTGDFIPTNSPLIVETASHFSPRFASRSSVNKRETMLTLSAKIRKEIGKKTKILRKNGILPGVLYGPEIKEALPLELDRKTFEKVYNVAGESSLVSLEVDKDKFLVLIHDLKMDPLDEKPIHVDFYQPKLSEEVEVTVPIIFEGEPIVIKELGGTLVKNISELEVKALPQKLPHEIKVDIGNLKTFEDHILVKDLKLPEGVKILKESEEIIASVSPPEKVEEELVRPIEEKVEGVEKVEEKEKEGQEKEEKE